MSKHKPLKTVNINLDDLQNFASHNTQKSPPIITNWLSVNSQLHAEGLSTFRTALYSPYVTGAADSMSNLKNGYLTPLLEDLEKLSKRQELNNGANAKMPKFDDTFYNEVNKPNNLRSEAFKEFLEEYSKLTVEQHFIEKISAQILIDVGRDDIKIDELKNNLETQLKSYKEVYARQTRNDIGARELIMLKDESGKTRAITMQDLESSKDVKLTGEQRDFIKSAWQQGSFCGGWYTASTFKHNEAENKMTVFNQNSLLIDISVKGKVYASNQVHTDWKDIATNETVAPYATGTLIVDITELKGNEFVFGCASAKPKIDVIISTYDEVDFIPKKLSTTISSSKFLDIEKHISAEFEKGYYATAALSKDEKLTSMALGKFKAEDPLTYKIKVERFKSKEQDQGKIEEFASQQIDKFSQHQNATLDSSEKDRIKAGLVTILEPLCQSPDALKTLERNAGKLVRECANQAGKDMSWRESWKTYVDKAKNLVSKLLGKENAVENLVNKYPNVVDKLKKNMESSKEPVQQVKERSFRSRVSSESNLGLKR